MCINHPGLPAECHALHKSPAHMFFDEDGAQKLAIEHGSDWIDFEDSEFIGGSDATFRIWGIPITDAELENGTKSISPPVTSFSPDESAVYAWLFATVGHRVDSIKFEFPGSRRLRVAVNIPDITEESDDPITVVTFDMTLGMDETELERPM